MARGIPKEIKRHLDYNPDTGELTWLVSPGNRIKAGDEAGSINGLGYRIVIFQRTVYYVHRVAYFLMTGQNLEPGLQMDHINRNRSDNRWRNLRVVTQSENLANSKVSRNNKLGEKHIHQIRNGRYAVNIRRENYSYIRTFCTLEYAIKTRNRVVAMLERAQRLRDFWRLRAV